ncbi:wsc domain containing protein [Colletotrichum sojae]|uniref:Wsc domain containing protein n=1 Tax=Colletotrichum sojae TaxID=2175907 RepID=A0A8H6ITB2_9PEZI|nr:wsc domain containing protein [Colletotrichum sojae]
MRSSTALLSAGQLLLLLGVNAQLQPAPILPYTTYLGSYDALQLLTSGIFRNIQSTTADPDDSDQCQAACALRSKPGAPCGGRILRSAFFTIYGRRNLAPQPAVGYAYVGYAIQSTESFATTFEPGVNGNPLLCQRACNNLGSPYLYMANDQCACIQSGGPSVPTVPPVSSSLCDRSCSQNSNAPCGGSVLGERTQYATVYGSRAPPEPRPQRPYNYLGYSEDTAIDTANFEDYPDFGGLPAPCQQTCSNQGATWMYMIRGERRCRVTGDLRPAGSPVPDEKCNIACSEIPSAACGGLTSQYRTRHTVYGDDNTLQQVSSSSSSSSSGRTSSSTSIIHDSTSSTMSSTTSTS